YAIEPLLDEHARDLWTLVRASVEVTPSALQDAARVDAVIAARRTSQASRKLTYVSHFTQNEEEAYV
ncbi:MAG: hypothetical protein R6X32_16480, partial [Chloroflexota bacterium]